MATAVLSDTKESALKDIENLAQQNRTHIVAAWDKLQETYLRELKDSIVVYPLPVWVFENVLPNPALENCIAVTYATRHELARKELSRSGKSAQTRVARIFGLDIWDLYFAFGAKAAVSQDFLNAIPSNVITCGKLIPRVGSEERAEKRGPVNSGEQEEGTWKQSQQRHKDLRQPLVYLLQRLHDSYLTRLKTPAAYVLEPNYRPRDMKAVITNFRGVGGGETSHRVPEASRSHASNTSSSAAVITRRKRTPQPPLPRAMAGKSPTPSPEVPRGVVVLDRDQFDSIEVTKEGETHSSSTLDYSSESGDDGNGHGGKVEGDGTDEGPATPTNAEDKGSPSQHSLEPIKRLPGAGRDSLHNSFDDNFAKSPPLDSTADISIYAFTPACQTLSRQQLSGALPASSKRKSSLEYARGYGSNDQMPIITAEPTHISKKPKLAKGGPFGCMPCLPFQYPIGDISRAVKSLQPQAWLNDFAVNTTIKNMVASLSHTAAPVGFVDSWHSSHILSGGRSRQNLHSEAHEHVLLVVNLGKCHWVLYYWRHSVRTLEYYNPYLSSDSEGAIGDKSARTQPAPPHSATLLGFLSWLYDKPTIPNEAYTFTYTDVAQQSNGVDCGIFVIWFAASILSIIREREATGTRRKAEHQVTASTTYCASPKPPTTCYLSLITRTVVAGRLLAGPNTLPGSIFSFLNYEAATRLIQTIFYSPPFPCPPLLRDATAKKVTVSTPPFPFLGRSPSWDSTVLAENHPVDGKRSSLRHAYQELCILRSLPLPKGVIQETPYEWQKARLVLIGQAQALARLHIIHRYWVQRYEDAEAAEQATIKRRNKANRVRDRAHRMMKLADSIEWGCLNEEDEDDLVAVSYDDEFVARLAQHKRDVSQTALAKQARKGKEQDDLKMATALVLVMKFLIERTVAEFKEAEKYLRRLEHGFFTLA
ncbi:hypothetical protein F5Y19DRAFT_486720 [Xylariaceae sp. FL1651]|nr:hypothetical protein F5Y19DRAFT_486720 [Xylariaceae sp. FL1651]